jgi:hypothetical protein
MRIDSERCEWCFYQLGLRPQIPIVDFYYLQYLLKLLRKDQIRKLVIYPSVDLSFPTQDILAFQQLEKRVLLIFGDQSHKVQLIDPVQQKHNLSSVALLSRDFLSSIQYIAGDDFQKKCRRILGDNHWTWQKCNRYHPEDLRLVSIYVHTVRGYIMWHFLQEELNNRTSEVSHSLRVGFLIWETEMAKLAVFDQLSSQRPISRLVLSPILGRTILLPRGKPLPVFEPDKTIALFSDLRASLKLLCQQDKQHNRLLSSILNTVLDANYGGAKQQTKSDLEGFAKELTLNNILPTNGSTELRPDVLDTALLIKKFQELFGV